MTKITAIIFLLTKSGKIKSNADFYKNYYFNGDVYSCQNLLNSFVEEFEIDAIQSSLNDYGIISVFDSKFPQISNVSMNKSERPYLLFYKGDISLLGDLSKNVAVVGLLDPDEEIEQREKIFVKQLVKQDLKVISGLAKGCDAIAHDCTIENGGKTIAVLPSTLQRIFPKENRELAERIINSDGLLITEYYHEPKNSFAATKRFIDRDRLQALFSGAIILTASYRQGEGDSGSRHAMLKAKEYGRQRYMMYNDVADRLNPKFGLNADYYIKERDIKILTQASISEIVQRSTIEEWSVDYHPMLMDKLVFDLEGTLFFTDDVNTNAYNEALMQYGYERINVKRITRSTIEEIYPQINKKTLSAIVKSKQKLFHNALSNIKQNNKLIDLLKSKSKDHIAIFTELNRKKACDILRHFNLDNNVATVITKSHDTVRTINELCEKLSCSKCDLVFFDDDHRYAIKLKNENCRVFTKL